MNLWGMRDTRGMLRNMLGKNHRGYSVRFIPKKRIRKILSMRPFYQKNNPAIQISGEES